jgi:hypothetical protein
MAPEEPEKGHSQCQGHKPFCKRSYPKADPNRGETGCYVLASLTTKQRESYKHSQRKENREWDIRET